MNSEPYAVTGGRRPPNRATWRILSRLTSFENPRVWWRGFSALLRIEDRGSPQWSGA